MPSKSGTAPRDQGKAAAGTPTQEPEEEGMQLSKGQSLGLRAFVPACCLQLWTS